jgi:hypothetical protein
MWPTPGNTAVIPYPKFKVGDRVKHNIINGPVGVITRIQSLSWTSGIPFAYKATWEPREVDPPRNMKITEDSKLDMDAMVHPEESLKLA